MIFNFSEVKVLVKVWFIHYIFKVLTPINLVSDSGFDSGCCHKHNQMFWLCIIYSGYHHHIFFHVFGSKR